MSNHVSMRSKARAQQADSLEVPLDPPSEVDP